MPSFGRITEVYPSGSVERQLPLDIGEELPLLFKQAPPVSWSAGRVIELRDARVVGGYGGSVIAPDNRLLAELSPDIWEIHRHELFSRLRLPKPQVLRGVTAMLATQEADDNYCHWLFDLLPKVLLLENAGYKLSDFDYFIVNHTAARFCLETLTAFGVPLEKIKSLNASTSYRCERMAAAIPRVPNGADSLPPDICRELSKRLTPRNAAPRELSRRLYLSRKNARFRRLVNEPELIARLRDNGFEEFHPEQYSFSEQVHAFHGAEFIAGPHGAAFSNLIFCQPRTRVLEIYPPSHRDYSYWRVSNHMHLRYAVVRGESLNPDAERMIAAPAFGGDRGTKFLDFKLDVRRLEKALRYLGNDDSR